MPRLTRSRRTGRRAAVIAAALALGLPAAASAAHADALPKTTGGADGNTISTGITYTQSGGGAVTQHGNVTSSDVNWTPPPCWYAPTYTPAQLKKEREKVWSTPSVGGEYISDDRRKYIHGTKDDPYKQDPKKDFNMDKTGKGMWWEGVPNQPMVYAGAPNSLLDRVLSCTNDPKTPYWVPKGQNPPVPADTLPTGWNLAKAAYSMVHLPDTEVSLNPAARSTVNLPTWAWLDRAAFKPVSVTATLTTPNATMSSTVTATPVSMKIDPGTSDAQVFPASGTCKANGSGGIGTPYHKGAKGNPPCGVTYQHASTNGPYQLKATVTWKFTWTTTTDGGAGKKLPDGSFGSSQDVNVQEVQTVVTR